MEPTGASPSPTASRRRRLRRGLIGLLVLANLVVFATWATFDRVADSFDENVERDSEVVGALTKATGGPLHFLVVGTDSRMDIPPDLRGNFGPIQAGERADVLMVIRLDPDRGTGQVLSIPRDLRVELPGHGVQKINAALAFGGPSLAVEAVEAVVGVHIHHFVEVDFAGFAAIVDRLGGIELDFPYPARDLKSGLAVEAGRQRLDGSMALAYARSRSYQELRDGRWVSVDADDLGRTRRQQQLILAILAQAGRPSSLADAAGLVGAVAANLVVDAELDFGDLARLAWAMRGLSPADLETVTLPVVPIMEDGIAYVVPDEPAATRVLEAFRAGTSLLVAESGPFRVRVLNGNGIRGAAGYHAALLADAGFEIVGTADAARDDFPVTVIRVRLDRVAVGEAVRAALGFGEIEPATLEGADVEVIVGLDTGGPPDA